MLDLIFYQGTEIVFVRIIGNQVFFATSMFGNMMASIDNIKLSYSGVVKEHPDLKDKDNWREEGIRRFKEHIATMKTEKEVSDYIIEDLRKHGFTPKFRQIVGFRKERLK